MFVIFLYNSKFRYFFWWRANLRNRLICNWHAMYKIKYLLNRNNLRTHPSISITIETQNVWKRHWINRKCKNNITWLWQNMHRLSGIHIWKEDEISKENKRQLFLFFYSKKYTCWNISYGFDIYENFLWMFQFFRRVGYFRERETERERISLNKYKP